MTKTKLKLSKLNGLSYEVRASRSRNEESVYVVLETKEGPGGSAHFWLTRDEAYALAHELQHEADWLARLDPQPRLKAS